MKTVINKFSVFVLIAMLVVSFFPSYVASADSTVLKDGGEYKVNVNFKNEDYVKKVLLKAYHNLNEIDIELSFDNKYEGFHHSHNKSKQNNTLFDLKSYNIDLKKILIGDSEYLKVLKEKIEFEKLMKDFSNLESFVMNEKMFGAIQFNQFYIPELKEEPSFFKKLKQKFKMN